MQINIAKDIKNVRKSRSLTQQQFADLFNNTRPKRLRTSQGDISKYEAGFNTCPADKYKKFMALKRN